MNKKTSTIIITIVCFVAIAAVTVGFLLKEGIINAGNIFSTNQNNEKNMSKNSFDDTNGTTNAEKNHDNLGYPIFLVLLREGAEYNLQYADEKHKTNEYSDIYIKFNSMNISKEKGDFDLCEDWDEKKDEAGNIINNYSYVVCKVTIINKGERSFLTTINNLFLSLGKDYGYELRSYNSNNRPFLKDYYTIDFAPNKEYDFNLVYIADDSLIQEFKDDMLLYSGFVDTDLINIPVIEK